MTHPQPARRNGTQTPRPSTLAASVLLIPLAALTAIGAFLTGIRPARREERGDVIVQHLGIILLAIVALVALFAGLQTLGGDVITSVRNKLGL